MEPSGFKTSARDWQDGPRLVPESLGVSRHTGGLTGRPSLASCLKFWPARAVLGI